MRPRYRAMTGSCQAWPRRAGGPEWPVIPEPWLPGGTNPAVMIWSCPRSMTGARSFLPGSCCRLTALFCRC